jgi:Leucine-rich repeat (LRR) protein
VICKRCNCDVGMKTIDCSNKRIDRMFTYENWVALNETKDDYEILKLDHNELVKVDVPIPPLRFALLKIDFSHNKINQIVKKFFYDTEHVQEVDMSFNRLTAESLKPEVFEGKYSGDEYEPLKALKRLRLSYNLLHNLDAEVFEHIKHLQELHLDNNPFQIIHPNIMSAFSDIPSLEKLDMSRMELKELPEAIFHPLRALKVLKLEGNLFERIPPALKFAVNLRELSLDENPIGNLNEETALPKLMKLEELNMTYMGSMHVIGRGALSGLESLKVVRLSHNHHLTHIDPYAFVYYEKRGDSPITTWPPVEKLFLDNNKLTTLDSELLGNWKRINEIHLHDNPWYVIK